LLTDKQVLSIIQFITNNWDSTSAWPDFVKAMRLVLPKENGGITPSKESDRWALLPGLCCQASGGEPGLTAEVSAAWFLLYIAAHLVDSVEDRDQVDEIKALGGPGSAINVANGLFLSASLVLNKLHDQDQTKNKAQELISDFYNTVLVMTSGQHRDINDHQLTLKQWWQVAEAKSGSFFSLACRCGAQLANDDPLKISGFSDYGFHLGMMVQIRDDIEDLKILLESEESEIPVNLQRSLAVAYALEVLPDANKSQLKELIEMTQYEPEMVNRFIDMLNQSGAGLYMLAEMERHYEMGMASLKNADPYSPAGEKLAGLISELKLD
jgi:geranylgeranyl pyrophosphate synthase